MQFFFKRVWPWNYWTIKGGNTTKRRPAIPPAMIRKAMDNFRDRLQEFVINNGRHLGDVIFKSIWRKIASYVLFINKRIFCVSCFVWFLLTFKMWELFLPHLYIGL